MKWTLTQVAQIIGAEIEGKEDLLIHTISKIEEGGEGSISFLANPKYTSFIYTTTASAVIVSKGFVPNQPIAATLLRVDDPYGAFTQLLNAYNKLISKNKTGIDSLAFVSQSASIGEDVYIGPYVYVGEGVVVENGVKIYPFSFIGDQVTIGVHTVINPHVTIYHDCEIGSNCILHAGCVIGSDGFGFAPKPDGSFEKIPQTGNVKLGNFVEVGANATLDRATLGSTLVKDGVKIDNLVQVAHNVEIGESSVIAAQSGIAGSTRMGKYCMVGGQVGIVGHLQIADQTKIDAQSGVNRSIKETGKAFRGSPIQPFRQQLKSEVLFRKLDELQKRIQQLEDTQKANSSREDTQ
ncbi:MAG: UDP-3-O-(3-hydroxymyristoyl)glucosamine N-acyltransferase [Bacteroidia bacterium]|nr:UDP-3-O-(3-hydroxymyristoyl)glucosamine N-acyltransferase [Bacteroidia bacterium]